MPNVFPENRQKEPSVPEVFPVFVRSLLGPHLVFLVSDCTPVSSLVLDVVARTGVPEHLFGLVVERKVVAEELTLSECGVRKDMTLCMTARLRRGGLILPSRGGGSAWWCGAVVLRGLSAWWVLRDSDPVLSVWAVEARE